MPIQKNNRGIQLLKSSAPLMKLLLIFTLIGFLNSISFAAHAEGGNPDPTSATVPSESVDDLLTNNNLRAYSGSTSTWSIASTFNYNGGTIQAPFAEDRPNIANASSTTLKADLDGSISVKYNLNAKHSLLAGFGVRWIAPFSKNGPTNYDGTVYDVMNPYIEYQYIYKWVGIQSVLQVSGTQWTQADQTAIGDAQQLNIDQENAFELGTSGVSLGASIYLQYQWFNKTGAAAGFSDVTTQQSVYILSFSPVVEYQLTEKINLRTWLGLWTYEHYVSESNRLAFSRDTVIQSIGVGISVTRNIFLYPNVQFVPDQMISSATNVGLTATINLD
jgi:hypothetical protein